MKLHALAVAALVALAGPALAQAPAPSTSAKDAVKADKEQIKKDKQQVKAHKRAAKQEHKAEKATTATTK